MRTRLGRQRRHDRAALFKARLARQQVVHLALERGLVEQLAAGDAIELGARLGEAVFVGVLHLGGVGEIGADHLVMESDIGGRGAGPDERKREQGDRRPDEDGAERDSAHAVAARDGDKIMRPRQLRPGTDISHGHLETLRSAKLAAHRVHLDPLWLTIPERGGGIWNDLKKMLFGRAGTRVQMALAAASASSAWPGTFTLRHTRAIRPSAPIRKVLRSTPMYLRPYMLFSFQTP